MSFEVFGVLLAAGIQGIMLSIYGNSINCDDSTTKAPLTTKKFFDYANTTNYFYDNDQTTKSSSSSKLVSFYKKQFKKFRLNKYFYYRERGIWLALAL